MENTPLRLKQHHGPTLRMPWFGCVNIRNRKPSLFRDQVKEPISMFKALRASRTSIVLCLAFALTVSAIPVHTQTPAPAKQPDLLKPLQYRSIGPYRGGRSAAVAGVASQPSVFYYGATGGGVWKTTDGGINWESVSDNS